MRSADPAIAPNPPRTTGAPVNAMPADLQVLHDGAEEDNKWLANGSLISVNGTLLGRVLHIIGQVTLARMLGPAIFGLYSVGWTLMRVSTVITPMGLDCSVIHYGTQYAHTDQRRFRSVLVQSLVLAVLFGALIGLATAMLGPLLAHRVFNKRELLPVILLFSAGFPLAAGLRVAAASTRISQSIKYGVYAESLMQPGASLAFLLLFYAVGWRLLGAVTAAVLSFAAGLALALFYEWRLFAHRQQEPSLSARSPKAPSTMGELLHFSLAAWVGVVFVNLVPWIDRLFVGAYLKPAEVGIYQAASQASVLMSFIAGAFISVIAPRISLLHQDAQIKRIQQVYKVITKWVFYANVPFLLVFCFVPGPLLSVVYGPRFEGGAQPLTILSLTRLIDSMAGPTGIVLIFTARQRLFSAISAAGLALSALLNYLLIPHLGGVGAALATGLANTTMLVVLVLTVRRVLGTWPYDRRWYKAVVAIGASIGALCLVHRLGIQNQLLDVSFHMVLSTVVFFGTLIILGLDQEDWELIRTIKFRLMTLAPGVANSAG